MSARTLLWCDVCGWTSKSNNPLMAQDRYRRHACAKHKAARERTARALAREALIDRTPKPCLHKRADHQHGTRSCYVLDRCRCFPCAAANANAEQQRVRDKAYGRSHWADAAPVREHARALMAQGMGIKRIVDLSGVSSGVVTRLLYGVGGRQPARRINPASAQRILALTFDPSPGALIDPTGTRRRLQALACIGWSQPRLAAEIGVDVAALWSLAYRNGGVTAKTAARVRDTYDQLWDKDPTDGANGRQASSAERVRREALARGWVGPLAWDDDEIDDPAARPHVPSPANRTGEELDEVAVLRAVTGQDVHLTRAERLSVVQELHSQGLNDKQIGRRTGLHPDQVCRDRKRLGLAANHQAARASA